MASSRVLISATLLALLSLVFGLNASQNKWTAQQQQAQQAQQQQTVDAYEEFQQKVQQVIENSKKEEVLPSTLSILQSQQNVVQKVRKTKKLSEVIKNLLSKKEEEAEESKEKKEESDSESSDSSDSSDSDAEDATQAAQSQVSALTAESPRQVNVIAYAQHQLNKKKNIYSAIIRLMRGINVDRFLRQNSGMTLNDVIAQLRSIQYEDVATEARSLYLKNLIEDTLRIDLQKVLNWLEQTNVEDLLENHIGVDIEDIVNFIVNFNYEEFLARVNLIASKVLDRLEKNHALISTLVNDEQFLNILQNFANHLREHLSPLMDEELKNMITKCVNELPTLTYKQIRERIAAFLEKAFNFLIVENSTATIAHVAQHQHQHQAQIVSTYSHPLARYASFFRAVRNHIANWDLNIRM